MRTLVSVVFLLSRGLGTGVGLYASAIILTVIFNIPLSGTILLMAVVTVVYDTIGGMKAVVYSDVIQSIILFLGIFLCIGFAIGLFGGFDGLLTPSRLPQEAARYTLSGSGFFQDQKLWQRGYSWLLAYFLTLLGIMFALDYFAVAVLPGMR